MISAAALTLSLVLSGPNEPVPEESTAAAPDRGSRFEVAPHMTPGSWWNLYFAEGNEPLKRGSFTMRAVRVVQIDPENTNWVRVAYPRSFNEHKEFVGIAARSMKEKKTSEQMIEALEASVSDWKYEWFNLAYVIRMSSVREEYERQLAGGKMDMRIEVVPSVDGAEEQE